MLKLGITGGIGSGKSIVSRLMRLMDVPVYIADIESKKLVANSPVIKEKLIDLFGKELYKNGELNKALLASYIFNDKDKLKVVNSIIHPEVVKDFENWVHKQSSYSIVAHEAAILFESGLNTMMDKVITVYTPLDVRIKRAMQRDNTTKENIIKRIENQMSDEKKIELSDFVINNDGTQSLILQVQNLLYNLSIDINK